MNVSEVASRLTHTKKTANGFIARCPSHEDNSPSLSISEGRDGRVLLKCFAGCRLEAILSAAGLTVKDLFPDSPNGCTPDCGVTGKAVRKIDQVYEYRDCDGTPLFENVRYAPKDFRHGGRTVKAAMSTI